MKIYKHTFNDFRNVVETVEIEVEENPLYAGITAEIGAIRRSSWR